jgi:hypothetical protein
VEEEVAGAVAAEVVVALAASAAVVLAVAVLGVVGRRSASESIVVS